MTPSTNATQPQRSLQIAQVLVLGVLFAVPAVRAMHVLHIADPDLWWHLRLGEWIAQHHAVPQTDLLSRDPSRPFQAYSWLFEWINATLVARFGLAGVLGYITVMLTLITGALWRLISRLQPDFSLGVGLTFVAGFAMAHLETPRPWLCTVLLFVLELSVLLTVRRSGRNALLLALPVVFALWANVHIQFINGLVVLTFAVAESFYYRRREDSPTRLAALPALAALAASALAVGLNPYGLRLYAVAYSLATQSGVMNKINELAAIPFRDWADWAVLGLALAAAAALGTACATGRQRLLSFPVVLFAFAAFMSFRSQRDVWLVVIASSVVLADTIRTRNRDAETLPPFATAAGLAVAAVIVLIAPRVLHTDNRSIQTSVDKVFPADAVAYIQQHHLTGPLFNDFNWGGYLAFTLRQPVTIDGRQQVYGDQAIDRSVSTWNGLKGWQDDEQLQSSNLVVAPVGDALTQLLRLDPHWHLAYEDKLAAVFTRNE